MQGFLELRIRAFIQAGGREDEAIDIATKSHNPHAEIPFTRARRGGLREETTGAQRGKAGSARGKIPADPVALAAHETHTRARKAPWL